MAHLNRSPIDATERPGGRVTCQSNSRPSAAGGPLPRALSPCLTLGILLCIAAAFSFARDHDGTEAAPDLPTLARARIETRGGIVGQVIFHPSEGVLFSGDALLGGMLSWDTGSGLLRL